MPDILLAVVVGYDVNHEVEDFEISDLSPMFGGTTDFVPQHREVVVRRE